VNPSEADKDAGPRIREAQHGEPLSHLFPPYGPADAAPRADPTVAAPGGADAAASGAGRTAAQPTAAEATAAGEPADTPPPGLSTPAVPRLDLDQRQQVITTFIRLLDGLYSHLPLKKARYAADPVQRLRLLARRAEVLDDLAFHHELARTFGGLHDAHTRYLGPPVLEGRVAMLPFLVEAYGELPGLRYIASKVTRERSLIDDDRFVDGVELRYWNAVPLDRAVDLYAEQESGGRPDSRRARALASLTQRALHYGLPPDEHWVVVDYLDLQGRPGEIRIPWRVVEPDRARTAGDLSSPGTGRAYAVDPAAELHRRVRKMLFRPEQWYADHRAEGTGTGAARPRPRRAGGGRRSRRSDDWLETSFEDHVSARSVRTEAGRYGYLRLWSFSVADDIAYVSEVVRLLEELPDTGLVVDLRANPGGLIWASERLLQLFTPRPVVPTRFSLLATPLTRAMVAAAQNADQLDAWRPSLEDTVATGEAYSQSAPITRPELCNDIGQVYGGPVVAVVDANTYSAGDLFAAGFVDNRVGQLVTVGEATGAGGANVWQPSEVEQALLGTGFEVGPLPGGLGYTISVRRATRSGDADGAAIEDVGVRGHRTYAPTRRDLLEGNADLFEFCGRLLANTPATALRIAARPSGSPATLEISTRGLDRIDVAIDGRPEKWRRASDRSPVTIKVPSRWQSLEVAGYARGELKQRRLLRP
jgi:hypothetical protein